MTPFALPALAAGGIVGRVADRMGGAIAITGAHHSAFVEYATWPPRVTVREDYMLDAARAASGTWIAYMRHGLDAWSLRWFRAGTDTTPFHTEPEPIPERDLAPLIGELQGAARKLELAHVHRIESVHACGDAVVCVPRHVGLGELHHPFVRRARDAAWREAHELPPFAKDELRARCCTASLQLGDGTDVLVWDGHVFADDGTQFTHRFEQRLALAWYRPYTPVAWSADRLFACSDETLVELGPDGVRTHLPGSSAHSVLRGPGDSLVITASGATLLYTPGANEVATIDPELIGRDGDVIGTCGDDLVVYDAREHLLRIIAASDLASLSRRHGTQAPVSVPAAPVPALDDTGAASRPLVAGRGRDVVIALGRQLRFYDRDRTRGTVELPAPVLAVACDDRGGVALTTDDALIEITHHFADQPPDTLRSVTLAPTATHARSLARGPDATWLVLVAGGTWLVDLDGPRIKDLGFSAPFAAATDRDGIVLLAGEQRRLATWANGELVDVPPPVEQIVACAALGHGRFACVGERHLFAFDVATRELEVLHVPSKKGEDTFAGVAAPLLAVADDGSRIAWCRTARTIQIATVVEDHLEPVDSVAYPSIYSGTDDVTLSVRGIAFLDRDHLAIALDHGRTNIVDLVTKSAVRLDPHVGDPSARWIFIFAGRTLIAD